MKKNLFLLVAFAALLAAPLTAMEHGKEGKGCPMCRMHDGKPPVEGAVEVELTGVLGESDGRKTAFEAAGEKSTLILPMKRLGEAVVAGDEVSIKGIAFTCPKSDEGAQMILVKELTKGERTWIFVGRAGGPHFKKGHHGSCMKEKSAGCPKKSRARRPGRKKHHKGPGCEACPGKK